MKNSLMKKDETNKGSATAGKKAGRRSHEPDSNATEGSTGEAFTLIELVVVIAIIGILSTGVLVSLSAIRESSRDSERLQDMNRIQSALELYYNENGDYPPGDEVNCNGWECSHKGDQQFVHILVDQGYLSEYPDDPVTNGTYHYRYHLYGDGSYGCNQADFYVLGIRNLESFSGNHPKSPGWSCPNRNWQSEFDWVTGGFE